MEMDKKRIIPFSGRQNFLRSTIDSKESSVERSIENIEK
jgi:hypothetical protein